MAEITNNTLFLNTTSTDGNNVTFMTDGMWVSYCDIDWLPYHETQYNPKWHILQGYRKQMESMWD